MRVSCRATSPATFWSFGYDPRADTISLGPYTVQVEAAGWAAAELSRAIYMTAYEVDKRNIAVVRDKTVQALTSAGLSCGGIPTRLASAAASPRYL